MSLNYQSLNPKSILRDALIDPSPDLAGMQLAYPKIFGIPGLAEGGVARGRAIDLTGNPGFLHGKLLVRNKRDLLGAAAEGSVAKPINAPRDTVERFAFSEVEFALKQFDGRTTIPLPFLENGFLSSEDEELMMVQRAMMAVHVKLERYCSAFFTALAADAAPDRDPAGWTEINWQASGGTDLDSSSDFMEVMSSLIQDARLRSTAPINAIYMGRRVAEKLSREASILGRSVVGDATKGVAMVNGLSAAPLSHVENVLKEYLQLDEVVISGAIQDSANHGQASSKSYIFPTDRLWIGSAGELQMSVRSGQTPRVINGAGAFCKLIGKMDVQMGPEPGVMPQNFEAIAEYFCESVALDTDKGTIVHNLG
jgi:hypothetical protein